jgi:hypothetical protein
LRKKVNKNIKPMMRKIIRKIIRIIKKYEEKIINRGRSWTHPDNAG